MERDTIRIEGKAIRVTGSEVWMTLPELVELFGTTAAAVYSGIRAILKENALHDYDVCKCIRLDSGNSADVYDMEVVIALAFRLDTYPAAALRGWIVRKTTTPVRTAPPIVLRYREGVLN